MPPARIRSVKMKSGGASITVFQPPQAHVRDTLAQDARLIAREVQGRMAGYAIIAWNGEAEAHGSFRALHSPVCLDTIPDYVGRKVRFLVEQSD